MKQLHLLVFALFFTSLFSCTHQEKGDLSSFVDPMIGTGFHGHTFPGALWPYGMVQLSPDTRLNEWDNCSGYHYSNPTIMGFTHTHYSGTGGGGGSDILFMPDTGRVKWKAGNENDPAAGYRSAFSHDHETAEPGYYKVLLEDCHTTVELTATPRCGFHRYTFPSTGKAYVILDLDHGNEDRPDSLLIAFDGPDGELTGYRAASGGLDGPKVWYFAARFNKPVTKYVEEKKKIPGGSVNSYKAVFHFDARDGKPVLLKIGLSTVSIAGARKNLEQEITGWDFDGIRRQARKAWNKELGKIEIEGASEKQRKIFYTALYHAFIHPSLNMDTDGRYRSTNGKIYTAKDFVNYTNFSLWDTWRALHPMQTIINRKRTLDFICTFLERYEHSGNMPIMEFSGNERYAMIGYHSLPVVADAWAKGIRGYSKDTAFLAMKHLANSPRSGKKYYLQYGFIPYDLASQSVARTLEYSYDDWCVTRLSGGPEDPDYHRFNQRGQFYRNLFKKDVHFMVPKSSDFTWLENFRPGESSGSYTEANAWQYTPSVFQDVYGLIQLMGGDTAFVDWLDRLFSTPVDTNIMKVADASGQIGQYAHGNEPSHHIAYLYDYAGAPWKTQARVRRILTKLYADTPGGICGNDDAGQMSAWYVLSALGFYAVTPGLDYFVIGSPLFDKATIHLENGKNFTVIAQDNRPDHPYIQKVTLNEKEYTRSFIRYQDILNGSVLRFTMGASPNKKWASDKKDRPPVAHYQAAPLPKFGFSERVFLDHTTVSLSCDRPGAVIRYTTDGSEPDENAPVYKMPFTLSRSTVITARCYVGDLFPGYPVRQYFRKITLQAPAHVNHLQPGLRYVYREGFCETTADIKKYPVLNKGIIATFNVDSIKDQRPFSYRFSGYLKAPVDGVYQLYLESNDGAVLSIDSKTAIDNDGGHPANALITRIGLQKGFHPVQLDYFQMGRAKKLVVKWKVPGKEYTEIPASALYH